MDAMQMERYSCIDLTNEEEEETEMRTITATVSAYMNKWSSVDELMEREPASAIGSIFTGSTSDSTWIRIGSATVTVEIADDKEIKAGLIESLKDAKKKIQADAEKSITEIDAQIQSLLAIEYKG